MNNKNNKNNKINLLDQLRFDSVECSNQQIKKSFSFPMNLFISYCPFENFIKNIDIKNDKFIEKEIESVHLKDLKIKHDFPISKYSIDPKKIEIYLEKLEFMEPEIIFRNQKNENNSDENLNNENLKNLENVNNENLENSNIENLENLNIDNLKNLNIENLENENNEKYDHKISKEIESDQKKELDLENKESFTTVMLKNIPNKYTCDMLVHLLNEKNYGTYDFIYLRMDFLNECNVGYAFINFTSVKYLLNFYLNVHKKGWKLFSSNKIAEVTYATIQGSEKLFKKFKNSPIMNNYRFRPRIFWTDGALRGMEKNIRRLDNE